MIAILSALSIVRLALLGAYVVLIICGEPGWGVPLLALFVAGIGCAPPSVAIHNHASPVGRVGP